MSVDLDQILISIDGKTLKQESDDATFRNVVCAALSSDIERCDGDDKYKRFRLSVKIMTADSPLILKTEEKALIKTHIGKVLPTIFVGRIYDILDPPETT
jgi:hypothetical protein